MVTFEVTVMAQADTATSGVASLPMPFASTPYVNATFTQL
jgi:hypothetical protein